MRHFPSKFCANTRKEERREFRKLLLTAKLRGKIKKKDYENFNHCRKCNHWKTNVTGIGENCEFGYSFITNTYIRVQMEDGSMNNAFCPKFYGRVKNDKERME